jgi:hypothetical protein
MTSGAAAITEALSFLALSLFVVFVILTLAMLEGVTWQRWRSSDHVPQLLVLPVDFHWDPRLRLSDIMSISLCVVYRVEVKQRRLETSGPYFPEACLAAHHAKNGCIPLV